jgi:hypothetical protein
MCWWKTPEEPLFLSVYLFVPSYMALSNSDSSRHLLALLFSPVEKSFSPNTCLEPAYIIYAGRRLRQMKPERHLYFHWSVNISGKPSLQRPLFQTIIWKQCSDTINKNFGNESYFTFSNGNFNYRWESPNATPNKDWWRWGNKLPQRHSHHLSQ